MSTPKNLTEQERLMLMNQYLILEHIHPEEADFYREAADIFRDGYTELYRKVFRQLSPSELDPDIATYVTDILDMHNVMRWSAEDLKITDEKFLEGIRFLGFDANNESAHLSYATTLQKIENAYKELKVFNSHHPTQHRYSRMFAKYHALGEPGRLTAEELKQVAKAGVYHHA